MRCLRQGGKEQIWKKMDKVGVIFMEIKNVRIAIFFAQVLLKTIAV